MKPRFSRFSPLLATLLMAGFSVPVLAQTASLTLDAQAQKIGADLQSQIDTAIKSGQKKVVLAPGIYRIAPPAPYKPHLLINEAKDLEIVATGVTLVCTSLDRAISLRNCSNVSLSGLTVDYDPLPFSQGTIVAADADGKGFDVRLDAGYAVPSGTVRTHIMDAAKRRIKDGTWTRYSGKLTPGANGVVTVAWPNPVKDTTVVGDKVVLVGSSQTPHAMMLENCNRLTLRSVTLHASTSFGFYDSFGDANRYEGCRITPGPTPPGATVPRLLSTSADGIHSKYAAHGPVVENCILENMADDGIAINGDYAAVMEQRDNALWLLPRREPTFRVGDTLRVVDTTGRVTGEAKVTALTRATARDAEVEAFKAAQLPGLRQDATFKSVWQVQTDVPLVAGAGDIVSSPSRNGSGFVVRNNIIRDNRARGILVKASQGIIEGNTIDGSSMAGIVLGPEPGLWMEADFSHDVVIRNNIIRDNGHAASNVGSLQAGAVSVVAPTPRENGISPENGHRNIVIEGNRIESSRGVGLAVTSVRGLTIRDNQFINTFTAPDETGIRLGVDTRSVIWLANSSRVTLRNNVVQGLGPGGKSVLTLGPEVTDITGGDNGVMLVKAP